MNQYQVAELCENDRKFCDTVEQAKGRQLQGKISAAEFWNIHQRLQRVVVKRHQRAEIQALIAAAMQTVRSVPTCGRVM